MKINYSKVLFLEFILLFVLITLFVNCILSRLNAVIMLMGLACIGWMFLISMTLSELENISFLEMHDQKEKNTMWRKKEE